MNFLDFCYDGINLSSFGFIACTIDASSGLKVASAGSRISFNKVSRNRGRLYSITNAEYTECLTTTFDICKEPALLSASASGSNAVGTTGSQSDMIITNAEFRTMMRWLNRREFCKLQIIPDECETDSITPRYYNASFNIEKITLDEDLIGLRLTVETDKPFGYGDTVKKTLNFTSSVKTAQFTDTSDEIGDSYPDIKITIGDAGNLTLTNSTLGVSMVIQNCSANEVITIKGKEQIILSSLSSHDISNDFNYEFLKVGNTFSSNINTITCNLPCKVEISYDPIIKDSI